jgi:tRNA nucleotidyltransferase (CCA-adding enzyme)
MHIIITHPNSDFDAVASLLALWLLEPEAKPVLPNSLNRNVRDFITLYENQLPFVYADELGRNTIDQVTIVDSQQLPGLRRLVPNHKLRIIDHHELHQPVPLDTILCLSQTGANTTQLVEELRKAGRALSPLEATLLLLGIYEDTGSLTYGNTTARDLQAAAWLIGEQQANLDILREYLKYPMSEDQKALYEKLLESAETHLIHGHAIMLCLARVDHYVEEISNLAHQLRDMYRPEALFILVQMRNHIQLVARSVNDAIDVAHLAEFFGGGGHPRASAALIKETDLALTRQKLLRLLKLEVQPATTVAQIMSNGVRVLAPNDTVRYAARMMDRYGHEGFPVIDPASQRVVGILSRREIDKARRHRLEGASISQFMIKGEFFVTPTDGIDVVQKLMVEQRIGQVPVMDPLQGRVVGIVTRTDLINLWGMVERDRLSQPNLALPLQRALSAPLWQLLQRAGHFAAAQGDTLYLVGGFVRDLLLSTQQQGQAGDEPKTSPRFDLDLVVEGDALAVAEHLAAEVGGRIYSHKRFGTAKWMLAEPIPFTPETAAGPVRLASLDFVTARTEFYSHPSALPEVEQSSIRQDLHRRDFTINTLALRLTPDRFGDLLDFYGGQSDLEAGLIRVLHSLSFVEDPTRMLRAARLMARLDFRLEERTGELLANALDLLHNVSGERISNELALIFRERQPGKALRQLDQVGILTSLHPGFSVDSWLIEAIQLLRHQLLQTPWAGQAPDFIHYLGLLTFWLARDEQTALAERLNLTTEQRAILKQTHHIRSNKSTIAAAERGSDLYRLLASTSVSARLIAWLALREEAVGRQLSRFERDLKDVTPLIDGHYLKETFNLPPGPLYRHLLDAVRDARLDGQVTSLADEQALVAALVAQRTETGGGG